MRRALYRDISLGIYSVDSRFCAIVVAIYILVYTHTMYMIKENLREIMAQIVFIVYVYIGWQVAIIYYYDNTIVGSCDVM